MSTDGRAVFRRAWWVFAALLFLNELGTNLYGLWAKFHNAKVLNSLSDEASVAVSTLLWEVLGMLAMAAALTLLVCLPWAAICATLWTRLRPTLLCDRARRMIFWAAAGFVFFHAWYSLHGILLPSSRAADSPLVILGGSFDNADLTWSDARLALLPLTLGLMLSATVWALWIDGRLRRRMAVGAVALSALTFGYARFTSLGEVTRFSSPGSVIVLGLDSFQANRLPLGGGPADAAPHINGFLEGSHRFDNAWTPFARTYPSWVSMFTGRYPVRHGVRFNLVPESHLASDNRYLADALTEQGYSTLHATDETRFSTIRPRFGFEEQLHPVMGLPDFLVGSFFDFSAVNIVRQTVLGHDLFPLIANNRAVVGYNPQLWVRNFIQRVNRLPADQPLFVAAHLCGNHWPFSVPFPYWVGRETGVDACIAMVDEQVGEVLAYFEQSGLMDTATVVMLSDHGDGWSGDPTDTTNTHGDHLDRLLANKVLLGVHQAGREPGISDELVRTFDLYPTVLELAGIAAPTDSIDGRSLLPLLDGANASEASRECFAESGFDKKTFLVSRLIEESASWYAYDPETQLITLKEEGYDELMQTKSYMLMQDDLRMVLTPERGRFTITRFDRMSGEEVPVLDEVPESVRRSMLVRILDHYGLDRVEILAMARTRGFLGNS